MDWKYLLSLRPEDLTEDQKDELYNTVTWFDCESEELNLKKCVVLIKVSQEVLKFKGEQVETLLHELDEVATKQGEEEARKLDSDVEVKSSRSRKSSSIEFENLEQKYLELKSRYKKIIKINEKSNKECEKLNNKIKALENENKRLQNELESRPIEGSESDISETFRDQQKELVNTIQNKNRQIADLLKDIEEVEQENVALRERLSTVKEKLHSATNEITSMTEILKAKDLLLEENSASLKKLQTENELILDELQELKGEKQSLENEMQEFSCEVNSRIDEWKQILQQKDEEIKELKSRCRTPNCSSSSSISLDENVVRSQTTAISQALVNREKQLLEIQLQLEEAAKEMNENAIIMNKLKADREEQKKKIDDLSETVKELKNQLKNLHERCRNLQEEVAYVEKVSSNKDEELKKVIKELKDDGQLDVANRIEEIHNLKSDNLIKEKQIQVLVKTANKLQARVDDMEKENYILRDKLGIDLHDELNTSGLVQKQKKREKEMASLKKRIEKTEEEKMDLKLQIQKLNKTVSLISNQLVDTSVQPNSNQECRRYQSKDNDDANKEIQALCEENEALRKGMHEILNSVNKKDSTREIKSDTLEKLLRALDAKHISGWYHPAMRLQAEVHNLEGINKELREQLREARSFMVKQSKKESSDTEKVLKEDQRNADSEKNILGVLNDDTFDIDKAVLGFASMSPMEKIQNGLRVVLQKMNIDDPSCSPEHLKGYVFKNLTLVLSQFDEGIKQLENEKNNSMKQLALVQQTVEKLQNELEVSCKQLNIFQVENETDRVKKIEQIVIANVNLNRTVSFFQKEVDRITGEILQINKDFDEKEKKYNRKISMLECRVVSLNNRLRILKQLYNGKVDYNTFKEVKTNLDHLTIKHRDLIAKIKTQNEEKETELTMLKENKKILEKEKCELKSKLEETLRNYHKGNSKDVDGNLDVLSQKLAKCEVNELSERQRANHTNNLYQLVKEQLTKSEEKFKEYSVYNESILHKNLLLQEQLKEAEDKLCDYVERNTHKELQSKFNELSVENARLTEKSEKLAQELTLIKNDTSIVVTWNNLKEQELLSLKHQIVDLASGSEEKLLIAQLNKDILQCRQAENRLKMELEGAKSELEECKEQVGVLVSKLQWKEFESEEKESRLEEKISILHSLLLKQKQQYFGCVPISSEEKLLEHLHAINKEKHDTFIHLYNAKILENQNRISQEQCQIVLQNLEAQSKLLSGDGKEEHSLISNWMQEKKNIQLSELRHKRQNEFKEVQLEHLLQRIKVQDEQIEKLDKELLLCHRNFNFITIEPPNPKILRLVKETVVHESINPKSPTPILKLMRNKDTQTDTVPLTDEKPQHTELEKQISNLQLETNKLKNDNSTKEQNISQLKAKVLELEMTVSVVKTQLADKQSQITFYEKHILESQNKKQEISSDGTPSGGGGDSADVVPQQNSRSRDEIAALKGGLLAAQEAAAIKDQEIIKYQTLLKEDRDKHSLAAQRLQEELQNAQKIIKAQKQKCLELEDGLNKCKPKTAAIDQYITQVHALEVHTSELHTTVTTLEAQLQSSRQEAARWRSLANDRLEAMEELRNSLEEQHKSELSVYKTDSEKIKEISKDELNNLKQLLSQNGLEITARIDQDIRRLVKNKDDKIHELTVNLRAAKNAPKTTGDHSATDLHLQLDEDGNKTALNKELEVLKRRYEQLLDKEKNTREELRELRTQLLKKPISSARSNKSEKSIKEILQKKIATLESEIETLNHKLTEQISINESHRINAHEDFEKWKKLKYWQQHSEKLKTKLKETEEELLKTQQSCAGYKLLISRLEREKHSLEARVKTLKTVNLSNPSSKNTELLEMENARLMAELETLASKLEMQQHHSGGLGAAMLQEKLEGQERKIAILELAAKGPGEMRGEMERQQVTISNLQKSNLRLESENLELKLDLEKCNQEVPRLHERIQHLENYLEILKSENEQQQSQNCDEAGVVTPHEGEGKKVAELQRTVFILKRIVEKLQVENKRLCNGKSPISDRSKSDDKTKRDYIVLKKQYSESLAKIKKLENEMAQAKKTVQMPLSKSKNEELTTVSVELSKVREQLEHKSQLLEKVKVLLHRAASREKQLIQEISELKGDSVMGPPSPIEEVSEEESVRRSGR